jgi:hypothetical protein
MISSDLSPAQQKAVEDALDILDAAKLGYIVCVGVPDTQQGGVYSNMEDPAMALMRVLKTILSGPPIETPIEGRTLCH